MLQAMYSGVSGLQGEQTGLDVIGNNIANVNTVGFKDGTVSFETQLSETLRGASAPSSTIGGTDPTQLGLGVMIGNVGSLQTQGSLQQTGSNTDMAISGQGYFMVGNGSTVSYTRDGSFTLDGNGSLVNASTGDKLLGYQADANGNINTSTPITSASTLSIPVGTLTSVQQTNNGAFSGNLDAGSSLQSTEMTLGGNLSSNPSTVNDTVYDAQGNAHTISYAFTQGTSTGTDSVWNVGISVDGAPVAGTHTMEFNLTTGAFDAANSTGLPTSVPVIGTSGAPNFNVNVNYGSTLTNIATSPNNIAGSSDGQSGSSPTWTTSMNVYDSLGVKHVLTASFTRSLVGTQTGLGTPPLPAAPASATSEWNWTISENGVVLGSSVPGTVNPPGSAASTATNSPLYFNSTGQLIDKSKQNVVVTPTTGATDPFTIAMDFSGINQLSSTPSVAASSQDGFPVGTLQSYTIDQSGVVNGVFSNGQTRALGQVALTSFENPSGLSANGQNTYSTTVNSGLPQTGVPGQSGRGSISTGYLEMSNVDLSSEFTNMITTERGFQANSKIVTTVDQLLQTVIGMVQ